MVEPVHHRGKKWKFLIVSSLISLISLLCTLFALSLLPLILPTSSLFTLFPLSAMLLVIIVGLGRLCKSVAGVRASAPAFVFLSVLFVWALYFSVIRQVISPFVDIIFNIEVIMVIIGLYRIMALDPGYVTSDLSWHDLEELKISAPTVHLESPAPEFLTLQRRAKYCKICEHYVMGFDHHCPAFGNCIGESNHLFFIVLLVGFIVSEASFVACASHFITNFGTSNALGRKDTASRNLVLSTMLFCLVQVSWQVVFLAWHVYCACFNIKTDEWINWKQYLEFQIRVTPGAGQTGDSPRFVNPYDRGILRNLKEFVTAKG